MDDYRKSKEELIDELVQLRRRNSELEKHCRKAKFSDCQIWNHIPFKMVLAQMIFDEKICAFDCIILDVNSSFEKSYGITKNQVAGRSIAELNQFCNQKWINKCKESVSLNKELYTVEHNSSSDKWDEINIVPLNKENMFMLVIRDITESKKAENYPSRLRGRGVDFDVSQILL